MSFEDLLYDVRRGVAWITINRPDKLNAFRGQTCDELIQALNRAGNDRSVGAIVLAGSGDRAFCTGGDQSGSGYGARGTIGLPIEELHAAIRDTPKPVIARVQGYALGGGNVLCTLCDLTICSEKAIFGQVGPKMGSVDPGYGTSLLARVVGEKKAREIWYLCRRYSGQEAVTMGLANICVPHDKLDAEVQKWGEEICERSPTAIAIAKRSFNMDTSHQAGIAGMGMYALKMYYDTDESHEGKNALKEKRQPNFRFPHTTQIKLGTQGLTVSAMGFGCMGITAFYGTPMKEEDALSLLKGAYNKGCNFFDTAEMYRSGNIAAPPTKDTQFNETIVGKFIQQVPRASVVIATKFAPGLWGGRADLATVEKSLNASLQRLGLSYVDLYYCHRMPATLAGLLEWMQSAAVLVKTGKVKYIGLSEVSGDWLRQAHAVFPVSCVQQEWSLMTRSPIEEDLVPVCAELGIGLVAYSPLARNLLTEQQSAPSDVRALNPRFSKENYVQNQGVTKQVAELAKGKGSAAQLSLAWLYQRARDLGVSMVAIPGSTKISNVESNIDSLQVHLSAQEMERLCELSGRVAGLRGNAQYLKAAVEGHRKVKPRAVIVAGAPASGKGTQCEKLVAKYRFVHISSGDLLRARQADDKELKSFMDKGLLVPDALIIRLIKERMQQPDVMTRGALLDGFPRTVEQARALADCVDVQHFIFLDVPEEVVLARIGGRRVDPVTNDVYHITTKPPPVEIAKRVVIRGDDTAEAIKTRLQKFQQHTKDVLDFYRKETVHLDAGSKSPDQVFALIEQRIDQVPKARL